MRERSQTDTKNCYLQHNTVDHRQVRVRLRKRNYTRTSPLARRTLPKFSAHS